MHSRIIQLENHPIAKDDRITPDAYYDHWFTETIADYVGNDTDWDGTLNMLFSALNAAREHVECFGEDGHAGIVFREGFRAAYFGKRFDTFKQALGALCAAMTAERFGGEELSMAMYRLNEAYDDKYDIYIQSDETGLVTLDSFLRQAQTGTKYHFGGTVDYHV